MESQQSDPATSPAAGRGKGKEPAPRPGPALSRPDSEQDGLVNLGDSHERFPRAAGESSSTANQNQRTVSPPSIFGVGMQAAGAATQPNPETLPGVPTSQLVHGDTTLSSGSLSDIGQHADASQEVPQEILDATEQAGEGGQIIIDSGEDDGYATDSNASNASTSLSSSAWEWFYENGRRYHGFEQGLYNFPNDETEQEREDMKHAMIKMLLGGKLHFAPIGERPQEVLDIGTGTGIWAIEMGDQYETANVLGVDLSPHQPEWVPPNVRFVVDNVESPWLYGPNHFDYIHSRHMIVAIKDWPQLMGQAFESLRPGGWMELQELYHFPLSEKSHTELPTTHPVADYWSLINQGLTALGVDFYAAHNGRLSHMMRQAGFCNIQERVYRVPIGTWPKNRVLKAVGLYWRGILRDGLSAIALGPLTRGLNWSREAVELYLIEVRKALEDNAALMYMPLHVVYGQKPTAGSEF